MWVAVEEKGSTMESTHTEATQGSHAPASQSFSSRLPEGAQRFLAYAIEHGLKGGRRTARDFIRHFPPTTIMEGLEDEPQLRANILVTATGLRMKVALKKSADSCGSDLQIALDERETDADTVVSLFEPDDRVRFLDNRALWTFLIEGQFWQAEKKKDPKAHALAAAHISYLIERALEDQLLTHRDVVRGISVASMTEYLPRAELPKIIDAALELGDAKKPFLERNLLAAIGISTLTEHIPLSSIWTQVLVPFVAEAHGLVQKQEEPAAPPSDDTLMEEGLMQRVREAAAAQAAAAAAQAAAAAAPVVAAVAPAASAPVAAAPAATPAAAPAPVAAAPAAKPAFVAVRPGSAAAAQPKLTQALPLAEDSSVDIEVDDLVGSLASAKAVAKKPFRRPGSIPPTA
jgi:hypothetical protein